MTNYERIKQMSVEEMAVFIKKDCVGIECRLVERKYTEMA